MNATTSSKKIRKRLCTWILCCSSLFTLSAQAATINFKLNQNGDPTQGGTNSAWTLQTGGSYKKTTTPLSASYGVDLDGNSTADVNITLASITPGAGKLVLNGSSAAGIGLDGNSADDLNANERLRVSFGKDVIVTGFALASFSGESCNYSINGTTGTTTSATVSGLWIALPAGETLDIILTNQTGTNQFRLASIDLELSPQATLSGRVNFQLNGNGDPTQGGTNSAWTLQGSGSYKKTTTPLTANYAVDVDGNSTADLNVELSSTTSGAGKLVLNGSGGGIGLDGNSADDINLGETLKVKFDTAVTVVGFTLAAFSGESCSYNINGTTGTTTSATVAGLSIALPVGQTISISLTTPSGTNQFRLASVDITVPSLQTPPLAASGFAPDGNYIRLRPLQNPGKTNLSGSFWQYPGKTAQDIIQMIKDTQPKVLERFTSGPFDPNDLVPVDAGQPNMTIAQFLNACMAAGAPGCTIIPRISLSELWQQSCAWSSAYPTNAFWAVAENLYNLPVTPRIREISLDNWGEFSKSFATDTDRDTTLTTILNGLQTRGFERIGANYIGGNPNSYGIVKIGAFGVDHATYLPKMTSYTGIAANASMEDIYCYLDFTEPALTFSQLPPDEQAGHLIDLANLQSTDDYTMVWPLLQGDFWNLQTTFTSSSGPYAGASLYTVLLEILDAAPARATAPLNQAVSVSRSTTLSWTDGPAVLSSNVYFGTSATPAYKGNQTTHTFSPGSLAANTVYYWRIDHVTAKGTIKGLTWKFTTGS